MNKFQNMYYNALSRSEKDRQGLVMAEALGTSFDVGVSVFVIFSARTYMLLINNISGPKAMNG